MLLEYLMLTSNLFQRLKNMFNDTDYKLKDTHTEKKHHQVKLGKWYIKSTHDQLLKISSVNMTKSSLLRRLYSKILS